MRTKNGESRFVGKVLNLAPLDIRVDSMNGRRARNPYTIQPDWDLSRLNGRLELEGQGSGWSGVVGGWRLQVGDTIQFTGRKFIEPTKSIRWDYWWRSVAVSYGQRLCKVSMVDASETIGAPQEGALVSS